MFPNPILSIGDVHVYLYGLLIAIGILACFFILFEFNIANNSGEELVVSSMMNFDTYCDDYSCSLSISALLEKGNKEQLDGTVAAGKRMNGVIGYEVPADWQELEIHYTPDFLADNDIIFVATKN